MGPASAGPLFVVSVNRGTERSPCTAGEPYRALCDLAASAIALWYCRARQEKFRQNSCDRKSADAGGSSNTFRLVSAGDLPSPAPANRPY